MPEAAGKPVTGTSLFLAIKKTIRLHPDWDDDAVAEWNDLRGREKDLIATARRDLEAG